MIDYSGIMGTDYENLEGVSGSSTFTSAVIKRWLANYDDRQRETIVDALFDAHEAPGADDVLDLFSGGPRTVNLFREAAASMDEDDKELILQAGRAFVEDASRLATERVGQAAAQGVLSGAAKLAQAIENAASKRAAREED